MDPRGGNYEQQARHFAPRAVMDGVALTETQEQLARAVLEAVLLAGLPPYNFEAAADGEETGVALVPEGRRALRLVWQQDPAAARHLPVGLCDAQQAAMNRYCARSCPPTGSGSLTARWARLPSSSGSPVTTAGEPERL
ncbi:hypothetical protein [Streptomyces sp. NBC_00996]|uniref:hypothetical protein n=1 Tax=Streptomyces sp. NBC_00996 TaxID=2903710 RepID=UPI00386C5140|nr:hypothetical protein OG390_28720 [Streptomyces sp. NBC_00996]